MSVRYTGAGVRIEISSSRGRGRQYHMWTCSSCWDAPGEAEPSLSLETVEREANIHYLWHLKGESK